MISSLLVIGALLLNWAEVSGEAVWTALMVLHFVWFVAGLVPLIIGARLRRRRARSGHIFPE